ncbi:MAG TPA: EAP30/Vps36 family vacuolar-sorting protein [candidate division Zixibacteria bacterium]|nr:EAP30/Vps36 family vacuolar-sorting protein [candidate division Zixibacteria bacterium]
MGLRDIEKKIRIKSAFKTKEAEIMIKDLEIMLENIRELQDKLKDFEKKWKKDITKNESSYKKLVELRQELGLPEEIGIYEWKESASFWDRVGGGDFFERLGIEILEKAKEVQTFTGGLMTLGEVVILVNKDRPGKVIPVKDVVKSIERLSEAKIIPEVRELKDGVKIVEFVPANLSEDQEEVLSLSTRKGWITIEELILKTGWNQERSERVLEAMRDAGLARVDASYAEGKKYYFPGLGGR